MPSAFVFDAFGTLFDVGAIAVAADRALPGHGVELAKLWRTKQLEYSWLTSLMERRQDFEALTDAALDYALAALVLPLDADARRELLAAWRTLPAYPDAADALAAIAPHPRWILSNGTASLLDALVRHAGLDDAIDGRISVDEADAYKPSPAVYALACRRLSLAPADIAFVSSNGWDIAGAAAFGFRTVWVNRAGLPAERHGPQADAVVGSLRDVVAALR